MRLEGVWMNFIPVLTNYGVRVLGALFGVWVALRLAVFVQRSVTGVLQARNFDPTLSIFFGNLGRWLVLVTSGLTVLSVFGIETTSFAAVLGAAGLAVGLAFQGTLSNFAAGILLLVFRPIRVGDSVTAAGVSGTVREIGLFSTTIEAADGRVFFVGNSAVGGGTIENTSMNSHRRVDVVVPVGASVEADAVLALLDRVAMNMDLRDPGRGHEIALLRFVPGGTEWVLRIWGKAADYGNLQARTILAVKREMDLARIEGPAPSFAVAVQGEASSALKGEGPRRGRPSVGAAE